MKTKTLLGVMAAAFIAIQASTARAAIKLDDVNIGINPGLGQLVVIWGGEEVALPPLAGPLFGFGLDEPGLITIEEGFGGLVPPESGANIVLEVIAFDAALKGWTPGFGSTFENPGDTWDLGGVPAHEHPFWHVDSTDGGFVAPPGQTEWNATFRILDTGSTSYLSSEPVTVTFLPEPSAQVLLAMGAMPVTRRKRRRR